MYIMHEQPTLSQYYGYITHNICHHTRIMSEICSYIYAKPKSQREKDYNDRMREKAEALRCRRYESIVNERYDFFDKEKMKGSFLDYFKEKAEKKGGITRLPSISGRVPHQVGERLHALREVHQGQVPLRRNQR